MAAGFNTILCTFSTKINANLCIGQTFFCNGLLLACAAVPASRDFKKMFAVEIEQTFF